MSVLVTILALISAPSPLPLPLSPCSDFHLSYTKHLCPIIPFCLDVSSLKPTYHTLHLMKPLAKLNHCFHCECHVLYLSDEKVTNTNNLSYRQNFRMLIFYYKKFHGHSGSKWSFSLCWAYTQPLFLKKAHHWKFLDNNT